MATEHSDRMRANPGPGLVAERRVEVLGRIEEAARVSGRDPADVTVVAVAKYLEWDGVLELVRAGWTDIGENRPQQLHERIELARSTGCEVRWHFVGRLQSRPAPRIASVGARIHTLTGMRAAERIARARDAIAGVVPVLIQVRSDDDPAKDGLDPNEVHELLAGLPDLIEVVGLSTMPRAVDDPEDNRAAFDRLRRLRDQLADEWSGRHPMRDLSMGTTQDFGVAVEEGASIVRLGRVLYAL